MDCSHLGCNCMVVIHAKPDMSSKCLLPVKIEHMNSVSPLKMLLNHDFKVSWGTMRVSFPLGCYLVLRVSVSSG